MAVLLVRIGVVRRDAGDFTQGLVMVAVEEEVLAVLAGSEAGRHEQGQEPVLWQLELLDDLRPQQRERVAEGGEPVARPQLLGDRRAADQVPALEDQRLEPGPDRKSTRLNSR